MTDTSAPIGLTAARATPAAERDPKQLQRWIFVGLFLFLCAAPWFAYPIFVMKILCFALFASAFNLLFGYVGLLSFGHAAYFGMASYVAAYTAKFWPVTPEIAILLGTATATLMGLVFGAIAIRRQGIYFAMITLALAQLVYFFAIQTPKFTHGEDGLQGVPRGYLFGIFDLANDMTLYAMVLAIFMGGMLLIHRVIHSPFGQILQAIRDNEPRAISLGYRTQRYKLLGLVLSAGIAGLAGATKAIVFQVATLVDVHWSMSGEPILMTLVGGMGTIFGPMVGAAVIGVMQNYMQGLGSWLTVTQGLIFIFCVLAFRAGIVGTIGRLIRRDI
ncbi:branched-chain amino acid ABC transporter permease [Chachezhania sediminis]|uniref:branched-chain amino acid ABC transporter permease n=1 Tax=Chachezhania sediminis TaxID=2599291 RepID=UPI00131C2B91|nr:branched-chain amino acid ABC transporter permease [Chachezhania sediminis]